MTVTVVHADSREHLKTLADASVDSCVCDPPYALVSIGKRFGKDGAAPAKSNGASGVYARASSGFMGQKWDTGETAFDPAFWAEVLRVLKPGGHVLAFNGTRTYHRLACAIEDAGFEIRDQIGWCYASGFPKSHDVAKGIDKARGTVGGKVAKGAEVRRIRPGADQHKDGSWEKLEARAYQPHEYVPGSTEAAQWEGWGTALKPAWEPIVVARKPLDSTVAANVLQHGTGALNIDGCRVEGEVQVLRSEGGQKFQTNPDRVNKAVGVRDGRWPANIVHDGSDEVVAAFPAETGKSTGGRIGNAGGGTVTNLPTGAHSSGDPGFGDSGSAARFFYSAKADAEDRHGSKHPTVKPVDLMAWLCRLVTPPGGLVLDPFAGSGSTGLAAMREGFDCLLIEREAEYVADIERRLAWAKGDGRLTVLERARDICPVEAAGGDLPLFSTLDTARPASQPASQPADGSSTARSRKTANRAGRDDEVVTA